MSTPFYLLGEGNFGLPKDAVTQKFAFVGKSGSGKTYGVGRFVEQLSDRGAQFIIIDPVGNWWGIRLGQDGQSGGLSVPVLGGLQGDIPLRPEGGAAVARYLAQHRMSAIVDVSQFTQGQSRKFVEEFAQEFFETKKRFKSPVMMIWEESQVFVPQKVGPSETVMVHQMELLIKIGRNYGVGTTLMGQRPQSINKDVLNQTECFVCFQLTAPHERKAVAEWMNHSGADDEAASQLNEIPRLKPGEAFVWSPSWLEVMRRVKFLPKRTFNFSKTPDLSEVPDDAIVAPLKLPEIALQELARAMEAATSDISGKDVKALQKRVRELEAELRAARERTSIPQVHRIEVPVIAGEDIASMRTAASLLGDGATRLAEIATKVEGTVNVLRAKLDAVSQGGHALAPARLPEHSPGSGDPMWLGDRLVDDEPPAPPSHRAPPAPRGKGLPTVKNDRGEDVKLTSGEADMVVQLASRFPRGYTKVQLATLTGYKKSGGGFNNSLSKLKVLGLMSRDNDNFLATEKGRRYASSVQTIIPVTRPRDLLGLWISKLDRKAGIILDKAFHLRGQPMTKPQMAELVEMKPDGGGFNNYVSKLSSNNLLVKGIGGYRISEMFLESSS